MMLLWCAVFLDGNINKFVSAFANVKLKSLVSCIYLKKYQEHILKQIKQSDATSYVFNVKIKNTTNNQLVLSELSHWKNYFCPTVSDCQKAVLYAYIIYIYIYHIAFSSP